MALAWMSNGQQPASERTAAFGVPRGQPVAIRRPSLSFAWTRSVVLREAKVAQHEAPYIATGAM